MHCKITGGVPSKFNHSQELKPCFFGFVVNPFNVVDDGGCPVRQTIVTN